MSPGARSKVGRGFFYSKYKGWPKTTQGEDREDPVSIVNYTWTGSNIKLLNEEAELDLVNVGVIYHKSSHKTALS